MQWNLIKLRKEKEYTQEDIAKLLNISTEGYRLKESGKNQFKSDEMFIIAEFFDGNIGDIFLPTKYTKRKQLI
ncbi:helix-turn-helix transcriptional regulator [Staphylococcus xylosus]|uniref:helix-turn-helix transcriptional regulator n=1 Tax=Staphylococcus xylosus TaxID=1288 RepID=UPI000D1D4CF6|nr:helix-turn-helix transcriptional regulator [Staphylococcus xylosus]PTI64180.1 XRE family transcriptional regulator [Staphylococcus xylosus]